MTDYIERQTAIDAIQQHREGVLGSYEYDEDVAFVYASAHYHIIDVIRKLPPAEPERKKGRWDICDDGYVRCSECRVKAPWISDGVAWMSDYCPNCGADLRGDEE